MKTIKNTLKLLIPILSIGFCCTASALSAQTFSPKLAQLLRPIRLPNFKCDNTIYVTSRPYDSASTDLFTLNPLTLDPTDIATTREYGYDAIGFSHLDGFIYGISNGNASGDSNPRLIRVDPTNGNITDLGTFPELANKEWIVGTIIKDGSYVIGDFGTSSWLRIDLENIRILDGGNIPLSLVTAWATNPIDNVIYGYQSYEQKLMSFDPLTHQFQSFERPMTNVGVQPCSTAFLQDGTMFLYCKTSTPTEDTMFEINLGSQTAIPIASGRALGAGDMATCAFKKIEPPPVPPKPSPDFPGTWQNGNSCIVISDDGFVVNAYSKCGPFNCKRMTGTLSTYQTSDPLAETNTHALITYRGSDPKIQTLSLIDSDTMRVLELNSYGVRSRFNNYDRDHYNKVKKCRWKLPFPHPHPKPRPPAPGPKPE
jgi:hypothetical protein